MTKHKCQGINFDDGIACENTEDTKQLRIFGDAELYEGLWVEVWLCCECADKFGCI